MKISICTWNILADSYVKGQKHLPEPRTNDPVSFTKWKFRSQLVEQSLRTIASDIYCLQEVDHYHDFYSIFFKRFGYETFYIQRPGKKDGCLFAYNCSLFTCLDTEDVDLDRLSFLDAHERAGRSKYAKQNVAALVFLQHKETGTKFILANCHIYWNPNFPEVKSAQAQLILEEITRFRLKCSSNSSNLLPVILTGDFNSFPHDDLYNLITGQRVLSKAQYFLLYDNSATRPQERTLGLKSLYGPNTKFLCDFSLSKLVRWMRILGIDVAMDSWESGKESTNPTTTFGPEVGPKLTSEEKKNSIILFFARAKKEKRVILTSSKTLLDRSTCPQSFYVHPNKLEDALIKIYYEFGLDLNRDRFLTVCGKCGGEIEEIEAFDERLMGKIIPTDRQIYACKTCAQVRL
jgi:uncharacterized protein with PIN domain/endonuclease/exonuclease/phosphatase family metal-dependent hydrolase